MPKPQSIGYYLWQFPLSSETFIQREIAAVRATGTPLVLLADEPPPGEPKDETEAAFRAETYYLLPPPALLILTALTWCLITRPGRFMQALLLAFRTPLPKSPGLMDRLKIALKAMLLARTLRRLGISHGHTPWADTNAFIMRLAADLAGISRSCHARAHDIHRADRLPGLGQRFEGCRFIVTNTHYNQEHLKTVCGASLKAPIHLIYNNLDMAAFPPVEPRETPGPVRILSVGRLIEQKGFHVLLEACALLRDRGVAFEARIIGGPELPTYADYRDSLNQLIDRLVLQGQVQLMGEQPQSAVREALAWADLFVLPCVIAQDGSRDITPNVLLEAMASGLPVISTPVTGIPEIIEDGDNGLLVEPGDTQALAETIQALAMDFGRRKLLGEKARAGISEQFNPERNGQQLAALFAQVAS